jgi:hypothetical protein
MHLKCILSKLSPQITETSYEVCNSCSKLKHLQGNWTPKIGLSNTSDLQLTKLTYNYNFRKKKMKKEKPL